MFSCRQMLRKESPVRRLIGITLLGLFAIAVTLYGQSPATRLGRRNLIHASVEPGQFSTLRELTLLPAQGI